MKKDAYYFPHFSNARNDSKLVKLRRVMGIEGYGMYFLLLETLREQTDFKLPLKGLEDLAYDWHTSKEKLLAIVTGFELFEIVEEMFFSTKLIFYLQPYLEKSERARLAAKIRWDKVKEMQMHNRRDANALQEQCDSNASKVKESKGEESKINNIESFEIFWNYFHEHINQNKTKKEPTLKHWQKLTIEEQRTAYKKVLAYSKSNTNHKYLSIARTYLSDKLFNDEFGTNGITKQGIHLSFDAQAYLTDDMKTKVLSGELTSKQALDIQFAK